MNILNTFPKEHIPKSAHSILVTFLKGQIPKRANLSFLHVVCGCFTNMLVIKSKNTLIVIYEVAAVSELYVYKMCAFRNVLFLICALFAMCSFRHLLFFGMCSFWQVLSFLPHALFGMSFFQHMLFLACAPCSF